MTTYYVMLMLIIILSFLGYTKQFYICRSINSFIICSILILVSGLRYAPDGDYLTYSLGYESYKIASFSDGYPIASVLIAHISKILYDDSATWFFIYALFTISVITWTLYKRSVNFEYSILLFIFMGMWHGSFNAVKQYAAIAILFAGQKFIIEKRFQYWMIICLLASIFHQTAVLMIPIYFLVNTEVDIKKVIICFIIGIILFSSYQYLFDIAFFLKNDMATTSIDSTVGSRSVNVLRVLVNCAPAIFYFFMKKIERLENTRELMMYGNFSIFNAMLYIISIGSVYIARFALYTDIFGTLLYPYLLAKISNIRIRILAAFGIILLYFIFWYVDITKGDLTRNFHWIFER